jgi:hypothetical protein
MSLEAISLIATILLALGGYLITYRQNLHLTRRKERLELINKRLDEFYGPLYVSTQASKEAFQMYLQTVKKMKKREGEENFDITLSPHELWFTPEWRIWSTDLIYPILINSDDVILHKAHLVREAELPECLLRFVAYMASLRRVIKKWEQGDFTEGGPIIKYPSEINEYAAKAYQELKSEQLKLISELKLDTN